MSFERGDFVWGKIKCLPWWPAMVVTAEDCNQKDTVKNKLWLFWFGDHTLSAVKVKNIRGFYEEFPQNATKEWGNRHKEVIEEGLAEILDLIALENNLKFKNASALLSWAKSGFKSKSRLSFRWKNPELPVIVRKSLGRKKKSPVFRDEQPAVVRKSPDKKDKSSLSHDDTGKTEQPAVVRKSPDKKDKSSLSRDDTGKTEQPAVVRKSPDKKDKSSLSRDVTGKTEKPAVVRKSPDKNDKSSLSRDVTGKTEKPSVVKKSPDKKEKSSLSDDDTGKTEQPPVVRKSPDKKEKSSLSHDDTELPAVVRETRSRKRKSIVSSDDIEILGIIKKSRGQKRKSSVSRCDAGLQGILRKSRGRKKKLSVSFSNTELPAMVRKSLPLTRKSFVSRDDTAFPAVRFPFVYIENSAECGEILRSRDVYNSCPGSSRNMGTQTAPPSSVLRNTCIKCSEIINDMSVLEQQDICLVCGKQDNLIYCTKKSCYRSVCKRCIKHFESEEAYNEILAKNYFNCYICDREPGSSCFIRRRTTKKDITVLADTE